ncbi:MAG TPA: rRNA maturation RNase YbeY [Candidatus Parcubacteria bacterium]|nr:rRNA maturation RNase YbeY [Candidatus Parcubacteria bacterium]
MGIDERKLKAIAEQVLADEKEKNKEMSVVLVGESRMRLLNKKYRNKDKPTDVLSFGRTKGVSGFLESELGEIVICPAAIKKNALKYGVSFEEELVRVLVHGILHLLGYNHERREKESAIMRKKENFYLSKYLKNK